MDKILTNRQIMQTLSGALNLLESDLYDTDNGADAARTAMAMANVSHELRMYAANQKAIEAGTTLVDIFDSITKPAADNPDYPDYFDSGDDVPPDDYDGEGEP